LNKIKAIVIDDSAVVRQAFSEILKAASGIELIAASADPIFAMKHMQKQWPDVIILDIEMPRMDGLTFLRKIMKEHPTPVVVCSGLTAEGAQTTLQVMSAGAVDIITKPKVGLQDFFQETRRTLIDTIKAATQANMKKLKRNAAMSETFEMHPKLSADAIIAPRPATPKRTKLKHNIGDPVIAIGASTGGTQALEMVLKNLPTNIPPILVVQHMPAGFTEAFARRLDGICAVEVKEAEHLDDVHPGRVLIAPGAYHMLLQRSGTHKYCVEIKDGPVINRHRPSVDVLFRSVAQIVGKRAIGVIMTGMGDDGARGLEEMHNTGAYTIAQNEETCVVYGMPREAIKRGAVDQVLALEKIAERLTEK